MVNDVSTTKNQTAFNSQGNILFLDLKDFIEKVVEEPFLWNWMPLTICC